jgi:uncharacterized protein (DUF1330 family)
MAAYILIMPWDLDQTRPAGTMDPYFEHVEETMAPYGGRYVRLRLDPIEVLEGDWQPPLGFAMMEFPGVEQARGWYHSPAYAPLRALRMAGGTFNLILADGMPEGETLRSVVLEDREREPEEDRGGAS